MSVCVKKVLIYFFLFVCSLLLVTNPLNLFNNKLKPLPQHNSHTQPLDFNCQKIFTSQPHATKGNKNVKRKERKSEKKHKKSITNKRKKMRFSHIDYLFVFAANSLPISCFLTVVSIRCHGK